MSVGTHIGTSGWHYDHWKGSFYPSGLSEETFLEYYAGRFGTAEINRSFYRLPAKKTLLRWRNAVPFGLLFSVKASRYLTHIPYALILMAAICGGLYIAFKRAKWL